jgi:hydroxyacylglutathione hydrolase
MQNKIFYMRNSIMALILLMVIIQIGCEKKISHDDIFVMTIPVGKDYPTNCYLVWPKNSDEALVIDPGFEPERIFSIIKKNNLKLKYIVHTHGHFDHTKQSSHLQKSSGASVYIHPKQKNYSRITPKLNIDSKHITEINDGDIINLSGIGFSVIHTPGHSPGSICLYHPGVLFSGDLLFKGAAGRTDFKGGKYNELIKSLRVRLAPIPDDTKVYPGHGESTNMGVERRTNQFILGTK